MFRAPNLQFLAAAVLLAAAPLAAQTPTVPLVNPDRTVTFTLSTPFADNDAATFNAQLQLGAHTWQVFRNALVEFVTRLR